MSLKLVVVIADAGACAQKHFRDQRKHTIRHTRQIGHALADFQHFAAVRKQRDVLQHLQRPLHPVRINRHKQRDHVLQNRQHEAILLRQIILRAPLRLLHKCINLLSQLTQLASIACIARIARTTSFASSASSRQSARSVRDEQRGGAVEVVAQHEQFQRTSPLIVRLPIGPSPRSYRQLRRGCARHERELLPRQEFPEQSAAAIALREFLSDQRGGLTGPHDDHLE